jgi:hypothetical protein
LTDQCDKCKTGKKHIDNYNSWKKEKKITYFTLVKLEHDLGSRCVSCKYNGIKFNSKKAKIYRKIPRLHFQQLDMFEAIE